MDDSVQGPVSHPHFHIALSQAAHHAAICTTHGARLIVCHDQLRDLINQVVDGLLRGDARQVQTDALGDVEVGEDGFNLLLVSLVRVRLGTRHFYVMQRQAGPTWELISCKPLEMRKSRMGMMLRLLAATVLQSRSISWGKAPPCWSVT